MISIYFTQKLQKRLKLVTEDEKKMPVLEALHSALIPSDESDEEGDVLRTKPLEWRSEEVSMFFSQFGLSLWKKYVQPAKKAIC